MKIYPLKGQLIKTGCVIFGDKQFMSKHTFHRINPSTYLFQFYVLAHTLDGYGIHLNTTN